MLTLAIGGILVLALYAHVTARQPFHDASAGGGFLASRAVVALIFAATFAVLWYGWAAWNPIPVVHDEMAYVLQAQIYARGHWSLPSPPLPLFWEQPHVLTEPRLAAKYFPGHPLLMALGALVHWMALMPLVLHSASASLLFILARRLAGGSVALLTWVLWLGTPLVLYFGPTYFSEATTTFCWLGGWYALLEWRRTRRLNWLLLVALLTGWGAIARPLTGVAYAIPLGAVVVRDVIRERRWHEFAAALAVGCAIVAIVPLWSAATTGEWTLTPLALYTRMYMPYDVPGFGVNMTPPTHSITPDLTQLNNAYRSVHVNHYLSNLLAILGDRADYLSVSLWGSSSGVLGVFAALGLVTLTAPAAFAVMTGVLLLLTYLVFATPSQWTLYYLESVPAYAFLTASGIAWAVSLLGRPRDVPLDAGMHWRSGRWRRALLVASVCFAIPGLVTLQLFHQQHMRDRRYLVAFDRLLSSIADRKAIVFVRYSSAHDSHVTFVRNTADPESERIWVVYDRGDAENARLMSRATERRAYLFDEQQRRIYVYGNASIHTGD